MKQTAVEWLEDHYELVMSGHIKMKDLLKQAKEMEKDQLCIFYNCGAYDEIIGAETTALMRYYETFKIKK